MGVGMRITPAFTDQLLIGILNVWRTLGVLASDFTLPPATHQPLIADDWNVHYLNAATSGLFLPAIDHWMTVRHGDLLGRIVSPQRGGTLAEEKGWLDGHHLCGKTDKRGCCEFNCWGAAPPDAKVGSEGRKPCGDAFMFLGAHDLGGGAYELFVMSNRSSSAGPTKAALKERDTLPVRYLAALDPKKASILRQRIPGALGLRVGFKAGLKHVERKGQDYFVPYFSAYPVPIEHLPALLGLVRDARQKFQDEVHVELAPDDEDEGGEESGGRDEASSFGPGGGQGASGPGPQGGSVGQTEAPPVAGQRPSRW
jgi:hypothetical protein